MCHQRIMCHQIYPPGIKIRPDNCPFQIPPLKSGLRNTLVELVQSRENPSGFRKKKKAVLADCIGGIFQETFWKIERKPCILSS